MRCPESRTSHCQTVATRSEGEMTQIELDGYEAVGEGLSRWNSSSTVDKKVRGVLAVPLTHILVLSVHFVQQRCGVSGDGHGCALYHRAGGRSRSHPLGFFPTLCFFLLQPLLRHLAPVDCRGTAATGPVGMEGRVGGVSSRWVQKEIMAPSCGRKVVTKIVKSVHSF